MERIPTDSMGGQPYPTPKMIHVLTAHPEQFAQFSNQANMLGYEFIIYKEIHSFTESLKMQPAALIINIHSLDGYTNEALEKFKNHLQHIPRIFVAENGNFESRFKAVQLEGKAYLLIPFLLNELITELDEIFIKDEVSYKVLIVDDEEDVAKYYSTLLNDAGMITKYITDPTKINQALYEFIPDLILSDVYMPHCTGYQLAAVIRQQPYYATIPIIYLSTESDRDKQLKYMSVGADDFVTKATDPKHLIATIKIRASRYRSLRSLMVKDNLTGFYNHSYILRQLDNEIKMNKDVNSPLTVAIVDLDNLSKINDEYGYTVGDHVIKNLSLLLAKQVNGSNTIGRYNNENFLLILPQVDLMSAKYKLNTIRKQFENISFSFQQPQFHSTFSAGVAYYPEYKSPQDILSAAGIALSKAKIKGKNRIEIMS